MPMNPDHDPKMYFFSNRVVDMWNSLPNAVVSAPSILSFENRLDKAWSNLEVKYKFDEAMSNTRPLTAPGGPDVDLGHIG